MSRTEFYIFPTEALLLGECLGEYTKADLAFLDCCRRRLLPMMPSFIEYKRIEGLGTVRDESRKSLMDLVLAELGPSIGTTKLEAEFWHHPSFAKLRHYVEGLARLAPTDEEQRKFRELLQRNKDDDGGAIEQLLSRVTTASDWADLFDLGKAFGNSIADCERALNVLALPEDYVWAESNSDEFCLAQYVWAERLKDLANLLDKTVPGVTSNFLVTLADQLDLAYGVDPSELGVLTENAMPQATQLLSGLWMAFGEALGAVREIDATAKAIDATSPTPRAFKLTWNSNGGRVEEAVRLAESNLATASKGQLSPEQIVIALGPAIEALARRIWSAQLGHSGLADLFHKKLRLQDTLEARFARIGLTLYKLYRNPSGHEMDSFTCTYAEARFFVAGITCLLQLSEILRQGPSG